ASFGIALMTHILETRQAFHAARLAEAVSLDSPAAHVIQQIARSATQVGAGSGQAITAGDLVMALQKQATVNGMSDAFLVAAALAAATIPLVFFLGRKQVERQRQREAIRWGTSPGLVRSVPAADAR
ncbi:MAG: Drug resistance transporter, EmrB/QacA subfamily, partial [Clostridia bacterium 62_21]